MNSQVYKKVGRKYVPIGFSDGWTGFPSDGVWLVHHRQGCSSSECIMKIGEVPQIDLYSFIRNKIHLEQALNKAIGDKVHELFTKLKEEKEITYSIGEISKGVLVNLTDNGFYL